MPLSFFARSFKSLDKDWVFQLFFQIKVEVGLFHIPNLSCQSRIRSRAAFEVARRDGVALIADAVDGNDPAAFSEESQNAGIQFADVAQLKQAVAKVLNLFFAVRRRCFAQKCLFGRWWA